MDKEIHDLIRLQTDRKLKAEQQADLHFEIEEIDAQIDEILEKLGRR
jgi:hypothetical protein